MTVTLDISGNYMIQIGLFENLTTRQYRLCIVGDEITGLGSKTAGWECR